MQGTPATEYRSTKRVNSPLQTLRKGWWDCNGGFSDSNTAEVGNAVSEIQSGGALPIHAKQLITG